MDIGEKIKRYMRETGRTQTYLCRHTGLSPSAMSLALGGKRRIRLDEYCALCWGLSRDFSSGDEICVKLAYSPGRSACRL